MADDYTSWVRFLDTLALSPPVHCPYFDGRVAQFREFRVTDCELPMPFAAAVLNRGYRRCGDHFYQPNCPGCQLCISYRIPVAGFQPSRSQRRVQRLNRDVESQFGTPQSTPEKQEIYVRYQFEQHHLRTVSPMPRRPFDEAYCLDVMSYQMYTNPAATRELELRCGGQLAGFGILDLAEDIVSAVYFVFHRDYHRRSLGTLAILRGIAWAHQQGYRYYHPGFFIPGHPKMDYKRKYRPADVLDREQSLWRPFDPAEWDGR